MADKTLLPGVGGGGRTQVGSGGNAVNAPVVLNITPSAAQFGYLAGLIVSGLGATAAAVILLSIAGIEGGTLQLPVAVPAGAAVPIAPVVIQFNPPLVGSALGQQIQVTLTAFGAGNTVENLSIWGFVG